MRLPILIPLFPPFVAGSCRSGRNHVAGDSTQIALSADKLRLSLGAVAVVGGGGCRWGRWLSLGAVAVVVETFIAVCVYI